MQNMVALGISMAYILAVIFVSGLIAKFKKGSSEFTRKFVHILVGNWVFIVPFFTDLWAVVLIPFIFIIINSLSLKYKLISSMERNDDSLGTVYYAVAMFFLSGIGFMLNWMMLPLIGLLTMAYGDGLAAIIGKKWGRKKPFSFAPEKSLVGFFTVVISCLIVSVAVMFYFNLRSDFPRPFPILAVIALVTGLFTGFIELTGKRGCDNLSVPIGSGLLASFLYYHWSLGFALYLLAAGIILYIAYKKRSITEDGIVAAFLTAATLYTFGGIWVALSLLVFFILGSFSSKLKNGTKAEAERTQEHGGRRNWKQVLCNSLPATISVWLSALIKTDNPVFTLLAISVFAAACADTFSSEIGMLCKGRVFNIINGKTLPRGLSGGVSFCGFFAGLTGSALMSLLALPVFGIKGFVITLCLGFFGSVIDSVLGSTLQRKYEGLNGLLQDKAVYINQLPAAGLNFVTNNTVNLLSLFIVTLTGSLIFIRIPL